MAVVTECPHCYILLKHLPDDPTGALECPRCHHRISLEETTATTDARTPPPAAPKRRDTARIARDTGRVKETRREPVPEPAPDPARQPEEAAPALPANPYGLASLLASCLAVLATAVPHLAVLGFLSAIAGLVAGVMGLLPRFARGRSLRYPIAGLVVGVGALFLAGSALNSGVALRQTEFQRTREEQQVLVHVVGASRLLGRTAPLHDEWVDASRDAIQLGDVMIRIPGVAIKPVDFKDLRGTRSSDENHLQITVRVRNVGATRQFEYESWADIIPDTPRAPRLQDDHGTKYRLESFGKGDDVVGHVRRASLPPSKFADDVLVFEAPSSEFRWLHLELPCEAFGSPGVLHWQIPVQMFQKSQNPGRP
jgi:hypothetical protein